LSYTYNYIYSYCQLNKPVQLLYCTTQQLTTNGTLFSSTLRQQTDSNHAHPCVMSVQVMTKSRSNDIMASRSRQKSTLFLGIHDLRVCPQLLQCNGRTASECTFVPTFCTLHFGMSWSSWNMTESDQPHKFFLSGKLFIKLDIFL